MWICTVVYIINRSGMINSNSELNTNSNNNQYLASCLPSEVTDDVVIGDAMESGHKGEMANW